MNNSSRDFQLTPTLHYFKVYRQFSSSQRLLHPSQRNYYRKSYLEHIAFSGSEWLVTWLFNCQQLDIILKLTVFLVHLNGFYTNLNAIAIELRTFSWTSCFNDIHTLPSPKVDKLVMWQLGIIWNLTVFLVWDENYETTGKNITINDHQPSVFSGQKRIIDSTAGLNQLFTLPFDIRL